MIQKLLRYGLATAGPVLSASTQFLMSLAFLQLLSTELFGTFSFLLVASVLSWGVWSALFCAPLPLLLNGKSDEERETMLSCVLSANITIAALLMIPAFLVAIELGLTLLPALLYALYIMVALLRWFARAYVYAAGGQIRTTLSDITYSLALLAGTGIAVAIKEHALTIAYATLAISAMIGLLPFGFDYLKQQFTRFNIASLRRYSQVWKSYSGWSLLGVLTTEATANSHAYLVTGLFGPAAFAPIAASALLIRPINVAMNALSDFERAQMARHIGQGNLEYAAKSVHLFRLVLGLVWAGTLVAVLLLMQFAPRLIFPQRYPIDFLTNGAALWMMVAAIRLSRTPESALLQALGLFRPLAMASVFSSGFSIAAVLIFLNSAGFLWSIAGIGLGESVYAFWIFHQARRWRRSLPAKSNLCANVSPIAS